jgi:hypothetical protein
VGRDAGNRFNPDFAPGLCLTHPDFDEQWLKDEITKDTTILGLGDLIVKDVERIQPKAGRLDLLLHDPENEKRYEVEIMLGKIDESHIIRAIEYWDIERKRFPNYEHCAVIIAEDITTRFLNIISLFNNTIPIIAIQLNALKVEDKLVLNFTKVLDEATIGEDEDEIIEKADRNYWIQKASVDSLKLVDECLDIIKEINPDYSLSYNKHYIGLQKRGRANNFIIFNAKSNFARAEVRLADMDTYKTILEEKNIEIVSLHKRSGRIKFRVTKEVIDHNRDILKQIFQVAYSEWNEW